MSIFVHSQFATYAALAAVIEKQTGYTAIVGGGALRDAITGKPVKDIDIFAFSCVRLLEKLTVNCAPIIYDFIEDGFTKIPQITEGSAEYVNMRGGGVVAVDIYEKAGHLPINVVWLDHVPHASEQAHGFDFGICQVTLTSDNALFTTPAFLRDLENHTFTITTSFDDRAQRRWDRLNEKYYDWKLAYPFQ